MVRDVDLLGGCAMTEATIPRATYRLQLTADFGFEAATRLVPYLAALGISHLYVSPILTARKDSTHGYDTIRFDEISPHLGGRDGFERLVRTLREHGMGIVVDFVPNHVGVGGDENALWLDLLEWGRQSNAAGWFDIDWSRNGGKLLVPFLGEPYGRVLASGGLALKFDPTDGGFAVWAHDSHKLPLTPSTYPMALPSRADLREISDAFANLAEAADPKAGALALRRELADRVGAAPEIGEAIARRLDKINEDARTGGSALAEIIAVQSWRPAHFRLAADEINYRRFFNISDLAGIRMEDSTVFEAAHKLLFELIGEGLIDGVRLDHIDGLLDPGGYCRRLRAEVPRPIYLVAEKILEAEEELPPQWGANGTTGYDFANLALRLLADPDGEAALTEAYRRFAGVEDGFAEIVRESKLQIIADEMASELTTLVNRFAGIARSHPDTVDFSEAALRRVLAEIVADFTVYRTYIAAFPPSEIDRRQIERAVRKTRGRHPNIDPAVFGFVRDVMTGDLGRDQDAVLECAMRIQQYSGPVMAKGCEDTAFYRYNRLLALNEVGGDPGSFGIGIDAFHRMVERRAASSPHTMLATSTHDTKRGEDARMRLVALSELADEWARLVEDWSATLHRRGGAGVLDPNDEYAFYQVLLGSWPAEFRGRRDLDPAALAAFRNRVEATVIKMLREAKRHSFWARPNTDYEAAALGFIRDALDAEAEDGFLDGFMSFAEKLAALGLRNTLIETVLKLTLPGVPDFYQGAELLDLSMVDPDNRRAIDFDLRARLLPVANVTLEGDGAAAKLAIIARLLDLRRRLPELFAEGSYEPIRVEGRNAHGICAFVRQHGNAGLLVACRLDWNPSSDPLENPVLNLPDMPRETWCDALAGSDVLPASLQTAVSRLPVAAFYWEKQT